MTRSLKSSKLRQPEQPASATVVTPLRKVKPSGIDAEVAGVRVALAGAGVDVDVDVHQSRSDVQAGDIDHLQRRGGVEVGGDGGDGCRP